MPQQYLVDKHGNAIGIVLEPEPYHELVQAREELDRIRAAHTSSTLPGDATHKQHSIRELRGLRKEAGNGIDVQAYLREERDSWDEQAAAYGQISLGLRA